jgi:hypothetical protein
MPNDDLLLATLNETRRDVVAKPNGCLERLQPRSTACDDGRFSLRRAHEQERVAAQQDQDVIAKMDKLRNHLNADRYAAKPYGKTRQPWGRSSPDLPVTASGRGNETSMSTRGYRRTAKPGFKSRKRT